MKTSPSLCFIVVLLFILCSTTPSNFSGNRSSRPHAHRIALITALPVPFLHLRFSRASIAVELVYRSHRTQNEASARPVAMSISVRRSGRVEFLLRSPHLQLAIPFRGA